MGRAERRSALRAERKSAGGDITGRHVRSSWSLPAFALLATAAIASVWVLPAASNGFAAFGAEPTVHVGGAALIDPQSLTLAGEYSNPLSRDTYTVTEPEPEPVVAAPVYGIPDPGTAQAIAYGIVKGMGWSDAEYGCLVALWDRESNWNTFAQNPTSGAYGIPQALPGEKMASAGADWQTNPATQITWGIGYIAGRYGTPCGAWAHSESVGWY